jgi:hypothetical protein
MTADQYDFTSLPEVDGVDVVILDESIPARAPPGTRGMLAYVLGASDAPYIRLGVNYAQVIARLWRELVRGEEARCHTPPFGLRFYARGSMILQASICWECSNIYGFAGASELHTSFAADTPSARALLSMLKRLAVRGE